MEFSNNSASVEDLNESIVIDNINASTESLLPVSSPSMDQAGEEDDVPVSEDEPAPDVQDFIQDSLVTNPPVPYVTRTGRIVKNQKILDIIKLSNLLYF